jgi:transcriptional regulator with XRE-family HTH domain
LLLAERKKAGLTQATLAKRLRRAQSFIATVERGQRRVDVVEFLAFSEALGFDAPRALRGIARNKP